MYYSLIFHRLLKAGMAKVYYFPPPSHASITHVMAKPVTENSKSYNAPCYPVSHIVQHLFGVSQTKLYKRYGLDYIMLYVVLSYMGKQFSNLNGFDFASDWLLKPVTLKIIIKAFF